MDQKPLTAKQQAFVDEYLVDLNATQAAIRAGYSARASKNIGYELLTKYPRVAAAVQAAMDARSKATGITAEKVLRDLYHVAYGDVRKLVEYRRTCCRCCYGTGFAYQRTASEVEDVKRSHQKAIERYQREKAAAAGTAVGVGDPPELPDLSGGIGWDPRRTPVADCPACLGDGRGRVVIRDTSTLDEEALSLYAGVKQTKDGIEVMTASRDKAREMLARHLKLLTDKVQVDAGDGLADLLAKARARRVRG